MLELIDCHIGVTKTLYTIDKLSVEPGKLTVLAGANGSGKSTLINAIALGQRESGILLVNGRQLSELTTVQRSKLIALVESKFAGSGNLSTLEYLELGRFPHTGFSGRLAAEDKAVVARIAQELNLVELLAQSTLTLSDGERQRAGIARALIQETPLILLDEPTSFLDYPNKRSMMRLLKKVAFEQNKIVLLASHDLELCLEFSDELLIINPETKLLEKYATSAIDLPELIRLAFGKLD